MKDFAGLDHLLQPYAGFRPSLYWNKQRKKPLFIRHARILAQGLTQWQVLGFRLSREPRRIGCHEGKGRLGVFPVLGQIEVDAADEVPCRVTKLKEILQAAFGFG